MQAQRYVATVFDNELRFSACLKIDYESYMRLRRRYRDQWQGSSRYVGHGPILACIWRIQRAMIDLKVISDYDDLANCILYIEASGEHSHQCMNKDCPVRRKV